MHKYRVTSQVLSTAFIYVSPLPNTHGWFIASVLYNVPSGPNAGAFELENFTAQKEDVALDAAKNWVQKQDARAQFTQER